MSEEQLDITPGHSKLVSVICVTRNRSHLLRQCLDSVVRQDYPNLEIIVFDNSSEDNTPLLMEKYHPQCKYVRLHKNLGFFPVLNMAISTSRGEYIFTIDDDAIFQKPNDLTRMVTEFRDASIHVVSCNIEGPKERACEPCNRYTRSFKTGFSLIRTQVFKEWIGYYPDEFFRSGGEEYLSTKIWDTGGRVLTLADVRMYHHQAMEGRSNDDWMFYGTRSQVLVVFMRNHLAFILPRLLSKFINGGWKASKGGRGLFMQWLGGWASAMIVLRGSLKNRQPVGLKTELLLRKIAREPIRTRQELEAAAKRVELIVGRVTLRKMRLAPRWPKMAGLR